MNMLAKYKSFLFSDTIWVILQVDSGGTLALMQQMVNLKELGSSPPLVEGSLSSPPNPFANSNHLSQSPPQNSFPGNQPSSPSTFPSNSPLTSSQERKNISNLHSNDIDDTPMT